MRHQVGRDPHEEHRLPLDCPLALVASRSPQTTFGVLS